MIGAIIGDIVGSRFEFHPIKSKDFELFTNKCEFTDDTLMTCAIAASLIEWNKNRKLNLKSLVIKYMQLIGQTYPDASYGLYFIDWLNSENPKPYNSFGNGSAMRVSPCGWIAKSLDEAIELATITSSVTHNHPEGIKGACAIAAAIYLSRMGKSKEQIRGYIQQHYYDLNFKIDEIRLTYDFDVTCQGSVPQAIECFLESTDFEDCIRNCISLGGDSDTIAAIAGSIAEAYYGVDPQLKIKAISYLPENLIKIINKFDEIKQDDFIQI